jgi:Flp pilus assembly pilin Flp
MADLHPVVADARARSRRTLIQGLVAVAIIAAGEVLCQLLPGVQWTRGWWAVTGVAVGQAALTAVLSRLHRYLVPPDSPTSG